jgi:hypothetical protein
MFAIKPDVYFVISNIQYDHLANDGARRKMDATIVGL